MKRIYLISLAIVITLSVASQEKSYFPTFDLMNVMELSKKVPFMLDSGENLSLLDFYGKEISALIEKAGIPQKTAGLLFHGDYDIYDIPVIGGILDLYESDEVAVKVYRWTGHLVFCVQDGEHFASYPCGITRFYSDSFVGNFRYDELPLERWIASDSGDDGWRIIAWMPIYPFEENIRFVGYRKQLAERTYQAPANKIKGSAHFLKKLTFDSFTELYYSILDLSFFLGNKKETLSLGEVAGMTYRNFVRDYGCPDYEIYTLNGETETRSLHRLWPLHDLISSHANRSFPIRICAYENGEYQLFLYFMKSDDSFFLNSDIKKGETQTGESYQLFKVKHPWKLVYADIAPTDPDYFPLME